jgi:transcriptional regulator with XRE-family HTH domain
MKLTLNQLVPGSSAKVRGSNTRIGGSTLPQATAGLPDDLAALFAAAPVTTDADLAQLEKAAKALHQDPAFIAEHAKGLIVEAILRVMEQTGISASALAGKIGKSRQYVSKILNEDHRVNFTIESLAEFSAALDLQLCLRLLPPSERMVFIRTVTAPMSQTSANEFPKADDGVIFRPEDDAFVPRNVVPFMKDPSYERISLPA